MKTSISLREKLYRSVMRWAEKRLAKITVARWKARNRDSECDESCPYCGCVCDRCGRAY